MSKLTDCLRCTACVYRRDTYRRTGRGATGFTMHYTEGQCTRKAIIRMGERPRCRGHMDRNIPDAPFVEPHWEGKP